MVRVRNHVNPMHWPLRPMPQTRLHFQHGCEVELGCADARFLFERAANNPGTPHVGVEIRFPLVDQVNHLARAQGLSNLSAHFANLTVDLDTLFADGSIERAFINFPDPWFKRRHQKRRLVTEELIEILHRKISRGGELFFQSDVFDLALDAMAILESSGSFQNALGPWSFLRANPYGARSTREVRCEDRNLRIWRMLYRRPDLP